MVGLGVIEYVVVLMLENWLFDNLFGMLYLKSVEFDGLLGEEINFDGGGQFICVWMMFVLVNVMMLFNFDLGEFFIDIN